MFRRNQSLYEGLDAVINIHGSLDETYEGCSMWVLVTETTVFQEITKEEHSNTYKAGVTGSQINIGANLEQNKTDTTEFTSHVKDAGREQSWIHIPLVPQGGYFEFQKDRVVTGRQCQVSCFLEDSDYSVLGSKFREKYFKSSTSSEVSAPESQSSETSSFIDESIDGRISESEDNHSRKTMIAMHTKDKPIVINGSLKHGFMISMNEDFQAIDIFPRIKDNKCFYHQNVVIYQTKKNGVIHCGRGYWNKNVRLVRNSNDQDHYPFNYECSGCDSKRCKNPLDHVNIFGFCGDKKDNWKDPLFKRVSKLCDDPFKTGKVNVFNRGYIFSPKVDPEFQSGTITTPERTRVKQTGRTRRNSERFFAKGSPANRSTLNPRVLELAQFIDGFQNYSNQTSNEDLYAIDEEEQ